MDLFTASPSLLLSFAARVALERKTLLAFAENVLLLALIQWAPFSLLSCLGALSLFLAFAFFETRWEYIDPSNNIRENPWGKIESEKGAFSHEGPVCPKDKISSPKSLFGSCPMASRPPPLSEEVENRVIEGWTEPTETYGKPILYQCHMAHRRTAPFKDLFSHSYLYVGTPVGLRECYGPLVSMDYDGTRPYSKWSIPKAWFHIRAKDFGLRGGRHMTLSQKLREIITSEGADPSEWAYAYLVAEPSVNSWTTNPLGFWYLYSAEKKLTAIIVELNTSFNERRLWLVRATPGYQPKNGPYVFRGEFDKDAFVSPFMPLSPCGYIINMSDPCANENNEIDILITLRKKEGGSLMVTRVISTAPGLNASTASMWEKLKFIARWCYVPSATTTTYRILSQAARIYTKAPRTYARPEACTKVLGRPARAVERTLERYFRLYLKDTVEKYPQPISVTYLNPGEHSRKSETFYSASYLSDIPETKSKRDITIQVKSPLFYNHFFHYQTPYEALENELLDDERTCTAWSPSPAEFAFLFKGITPAKSDIYPSTKSREQWRLVSLLRGAPVAVGYPHTSPYQPFKGLSAMDQWVIQQCSKDQVREYRRSLLGIFLGDRIAGVVGPLKQLSEDFEQVGLSRDAVLKIYDAWIKTGLVVGTKIVLQRTGESGGDLSQELIGWTAFAALNIWACFKAVW
ncbi:hypothetical protein AJ79_02953 [Helicocarpus griseus UAMH5409]|uniref:DUF1365 domain-containing protein n=1 Tax=Helicocarpus griseus UAMH5409 TaxID=1447875 RepID=A0A2B7Y1E0_9EURO|nr:hypothetical protein AJ79_02953 [Helicocarpus griseus UAMH5409]